MSVDFVSVPLLYVGLLGLLAATSLLVFRVIGLSHEIDGCRHLLSTLVYSERQMHRRFADLSQAMSYLNSQVDEMCQQMNYDDGCRSSEDVSIKASNGYEQAIELLILGLDAKDVADRCGLSKAEVELVDLLRNTGKRLGG